MAIHLAKAVGKLPCLQTIDLSDNGLTDAGLKPMLLAILSIPTLTELNVSQNVIGPESAEALAVYVGKEDCPLVKLIMQRADVDDFEGEAFVTAMSHSKNLKYLDLSMNKLGQAENLNTVMPHLITAPEALAGLLRTPSCVLETLIVSWNMIRLDSAIDLASSIASNSSLTHLDISDNSLNAEGGKVLGEALIDNRTIKKLLICNNNISASACFTICVGVQENLALEYLSMDGNPIGEAGANALMLIPTSCGGRVKVSAKNCNHQVKDPQCWFNFNQPCDDYELKLSHPFDRSVAFQLLRIMANHMTFIGVKVSYQYPTEKGQRPITEKLELKQFVSMEKMDFFSLEQRELYENLELMRQSAKQISKLTELFNKADIDKSGELNKFELCLVLDQCGISISDAKLNEMILQYDVDGEGTIELNEFLAFISSLHEEAVVKLKDMCETIHMAQEQFPDKRYIPPKEGILRLELIDGFAKKDMYQVITDSDRINITQAAAATGDMSNLLPLGFEGMKIRADEAMELYETMLREMGDKIAVLIKLLPQLTSPKEAKKFIKKATANDIQQIQSIKVALGQSVKPILGNPCGFYFLDLANPVNRICLAQLFEHSQTLGKRMQARCKMMDQWSFGDTSQHQNWSCFRNEVFNNSPITLTPKDFTPIPKSGKLSFDFSTCGYRPEGIPTIISDQKIIKLLITAELIEPIEKLIYSTQLEKMKPDKKMLQDANRGIGMTLHEFSTEEAIEIAEHCQNFTNNICNRVTIILECSRREELPAEFVDQNALKRIPTADMSPPRSAKPDTAGSREGMRPPPGREGGWNKSFLQKPEPVADEFVLLDSLESFGSGSSLSSRVEKEDTFKALERKSSSMQNNLNASFLKSRDASFTDFFSTFNKMDAIQAEEIEKNKSRERYKAIIHSKKVNDYAKADSCFAMLVELLAGYGLYCRHIALVLKSFRLGQNKKTTYFGSYRTELLVDLFPNIVDIHNFELIWKVLTPYEVACVYSRIGRLVLFNPMKPEGGGVLNLSQHEDRHVAKMILMLSAVEPGDNIKDAGFRLYYDQQNIPGWEINSLWMTEEGVQKKGFFTYNYYTGEGKNLAGCRADLRWRTAMLHSVLINEVDILKDVNPAISDDEIAAKIQATDDFMASTSEKWTTYLRFKPEKEVHAFELSK